MLKRLGLCAAAVLFAIGTATPAHAALVTFTTTGTFGSSGTSTFSVPGVTITFAGNPTTVVAPSSVTFGTFSTIGTSATSLTPVSDTFTLKVFQTVPGAGTGTFVGTLAGTIRVTQSKAYVEFAAPLSIKIGDVTYTITEADAGHAGRAELKPPSSGGTSTVEGTVSVPEPASALLLGLGFLGSAAAARRRRKTQA